MTRGKMMLSEAELVNSLFDTAISYLRTSGDEALLKRMERERWRHVEIVLSSEPSSEPGFFRVATNPIILDDDDDDDKSNTCPNTLQDMIMGDGEQCDIYDAKIEEKSINDHNTVYNHTNNHNQPTITGRRSERQTAVARDPQCRTL